MESSVSSGQSLSRVRLFVIPWTAAFQASLSITNSLSLLKVRSIESVMTSNHVILSCSLLVLPSVFPSIRVFSNESVLRIRWPKYQSFSFSISPSNKYTGFLQNRLVGSPCSPRNFPESFPAPQFNSILYLYCYFFLQCTSKQYRFFIDQFNTYYRILKEKIKLYNKEIVKIIRFLCFIVRFKGQGL